MSDINVGFSFRDTANSFIFAQGTFNLDDQTGNINSIAGTINGNTIQGLSSFNGADNVLKKEVIIGISTNSYAYHWSADAKGFSFTDGAFQYNLIGTGSGLGQIAQFGETLYSSSGTTRTADFYTDNAIQSPPVCFSSGTCIQTTRGNVAVEDLQVGDMAVTASGTLRRIAWIGHRCLDGLGGILPHDQQPIRIRAGAFGPGRPARDLLLSPGHPVLVGADEDGAGGHLVPIMCLINGTTIAREPVASVTYWHVELDSHDILLAEGLPAESYLDWGDRSFFTEASDHALRNPDFVAPGLSTRCRPVALDGPVVEAERARLSALFAVTLGAACAWDEAERFAWIAA